MEHRLNFVYIYTVHKSSFSQRLESQLSLPSEKVAAPKSVRQFRLVLVLPAVLKVWLCI